MKKSEVLKAAKALIEKPESWLQNEALALNGDTNVLINEANQFCAMGAIECVATGAGVSMWPSINLFDTSASDLTRFNDTHTHAEVLAAFDRAIELAGED